MFARKILKSYPKRQVETVKRFAWIIIIVAALTVANLWTLDKQVELRSKLTQLQGDGERLAGQVAELEKQLQELRVSHELYVLVSEDLDRRLARAEAGKRPVWYGD